MPLLRTPMCKVDYAVCTLITPQSSFAMYRWYTVPMYLTISICTAPVHLRMGDSLAPK